MEAHVTGHSRDALAQQLTARDHVWFADEPAEAGSLNVGPTPIELLLGALIGCTSITLKMWLARRDWPIGEIHTEASRDEDQIRLDISVQGPLDEKQLAALERVAGQCPVSQLISAQITKSISCRS